MKKKYYILFSLYFIVFTLYSQQNKKVSLEWSNANVKFENLEYKYPTFQEQFAHFDPIEKKILFRTNIFSEGNKVEINAVNTISMSKDDLLDIDLKKIPNNFGFSFSNFQARDENYTSLVFNPFFFQNGELRKVISFEYTFLNSNEKNIQDEMNLPPVTSNSVLASGDWYKFYVEKSGVYRVSKSFLQSLGFNTDVNPKNIKIYGNGGRMLPLSNSENINFDLAENAIQFIGEEDGVFNDQDFILFYAEGTDNWNYESQTHLNLFDNKSYYYVTYSSTLGKRIQEQIQPDGDATINYTSFDDYQFYEKDLVNLGKLGRKWMGEEFGIVDERTFDFVIPNIVPNTNVNVFVNVAAASKEASSFQVLANSQTLGTITVMALPDHTAGVENFLNSNFVSSSSNLSVKLVYDNAGIPSAKGYLDYIIVKAKRNLTGFGKQFRFQNNDQQNNIGIGQYSLSSAQSIMAVWDITDITNVSKLTNSNQSSFQFKTTLGVEKKYIAVDVNDIYSPLKLSNSRVSNQNIKGTIFLNSQGNFEDVDYIIVTPNALKNQASNLATFHKAKNQLNTKVVTLESIYEEFGSGKQDVAAIRNFIRYVYFNASIPSKRLKYVNLYGDASYDYKDRIRNNTNVVPVFHGLNPNNSNSQNNYSNFSLLSSFMSDDFYGLMDENEGSMVNSADGIDIAVGRMLINSVEQANEMNNKVFKYYDFDSYGKWRNSYVVLSDDADNVSDSQLQFSLNNLIDNLNNSFPNINPKKIHTDSYEQIVSAGGERYPKASQDFLNAFQLGSLVINYYGHGGEDGFARERLFEVDDAQNLYNPNNLPLLITMTCEFSRFDNPSKETGGEFTYWNKNGGAISLVSTTRLIFVPVASSMNDNFNTFLYTPVNGEQLAISEALRKAKVMNSSDNRRVVFYIGDPAIKLPIPKAKVVLTKINDAPVSGVTDVLNALSYVTMAGEVQSENGTLLSNYNGDLAVQIFDKNIQRQTLGNNGVTNNSNQLITMNFTTLGETIFRGNASIVNGKFQFGFVVPKDIKIAEGNGKVSFYAKSSNPILQDQSGVDFSVRIGGINANAPLDNTPPVVRLYMNDESFVYGGITNESPIFLAFLEDENGINTASGIGHDIVAILDGDETNPYILNDYYETINDNYKKGKVRFPFRDLKPGLHTITFKAWDVYNNLITSEIQFLVLGDANVSLDKVLNYPNPFVNYTEFWFNHNRPNELLDVQVQIMTITGKLVKTINQTIQTEGFLSREIKWDGKDDFGDKIGKGVYIYKLTVKSSVDGKKAEKIEKLVIL